MLRRYAAWVAVLCSVPLVVRAQAVDGGVGVPDAGGVAAATDAGEPDLREDGDGGLGLVVVGETEGLETLEELVAPEPPPALALKASDKSRIDACLAREPGVPSADAFCSQAYEVCMSRGDLEACSSPVWAVLRSKLPGPRNASVVSEETEPRAMVGVTPRPQEKPADVLKDLSECSTNPECTSLLWLRLHGRDAYDRIRLWCDQSRYAVRHKRGIEDVCNAITAYHRPDDTKDKKDALERDAAFEAAQGRAERSRAVLEASVEALARVVKEREAADGALREAGETFVERNADQMIKRRTVAELLRLRQAARPAERSSGLPALRAAYKAYAGAAHESARAERAFVAAVASPGVQDARTQVQHALPERAAADEALEKARTALETGNASLARVARYQLLRFQRLLTEPLYACGGWGLILPLFSARKPDGQAWELKGPVAAGIGGGYYLDVACEQDLTWGVNFFGFSEGLDPGKTFHVALGASVSLAAFKYFSFGVGAGYDLFRHEAATETTPARTIGLLPDGPLRQDSLTFLFTFSVKSEAETKNEQPADATRVNRDSTR